MHIVLVEDNVVLRKAIEKVLKFEGYATTCFDNGKVGYTWLSNNKGVFDFVVLDILLPGMDGLEICKELRRDGNTVPILMLTSKGGLEDVVQGLDCGADDYLKKPFAFTEILARIRSLSRRQPDMIKTQIAITPDVIIDLLAQKVYKEGTEVHLTAKEFSLLSYFIAHPNTVLTQQNLYDHVFDFAEVQLSNTIEVHIKNLRKKLRTTFEIPIITMRNAGYRFEYEK